MIYWVNFFSPPLFTHVWNLLLTLNDLYNTVISHWNYMCRAEAKKVTNKECRTKTFLLNSFKAEH